MLRWVPLGGGGRCRLHYPPKLQSRTQTVLNNVVAGAPLHDIINDTTLQFFSEATDDSVTVIHTALVVVISASLAIVALAVLFVPFLNAINRQRDQYIRCVRVSVRGAFAYAQRPCVRRTRVHELAMM